ncbi:MAG: PLDc N-terminal domain-containing protein [Marmoricola sp.]
MFFTGGSSAVLVVLLLGLVMTAVWLFALVEALRVTDPVWERAGQSKLVWVVVVVLTGWLGALLYALIARPALRRVQPA